MKIMSKRQLSIKEALSARRQATDGVSRPPECSEEQFVDSDVDDSMLQSQTKVLESEPSHSVSEHDERSDEPKEMHVDLLQAPHQPRSGVFPKRQFGHKKPEYRCFRPSWFDNKSWSDWLHWESGDNKVYCFICRNVYVLKQLNMSKNQESAFVTSGYNNWKEAARSFELHHKSSCHREAVLKWEHHCRGVDISRQLQRQLTAEQAEARNCLRKIFTSIEYLARQALPLRGHQEDRGNFIQLLNLRVADSDALKKWLEKRRSYTSHEVQNEMLKIMAHQIQRSIMKEISTSLWFSVIADETVDISLVQQVCK